LGSKAHNKYGVQILKICFLKEFILYLPFNFRLKSFLFLGVQYRWSFPSEFRNSTSFSEEEVSWLEGTCSHPECVFTLSAKGVNSLFYFKVIFKSFRFFVPFKLVRKYSAYAYSQNVRASS